MATTLVISPHLDDAVLSLGGSIARWTAAGERVVIATVYTTGPALDDIAPRLRKFGDYATRRAEDEAACAALGAERRWLDRVERVFRQPPLRGLGAFTTPADRDGLTALADVTRALAPLAALDPARILVPLGIGNHVDHVEALTAATDWVIAAGLRDRLAFYEDFYALSGAMRRRHPVTRVRPWPHRRSPLLRAPRLAVILRVIAASARGPDATHFLAAPLRDATWTVARSELDEDRKLSAIACYASQTKAFGGVRGITAATRALHAWWGGAEPLWTAA